MAPWLSCSSVAARRLPRTSLNDNPRFFIQSGQPRMAQGGGHDQYPPPATRASELFASTPNTALTASPQPEGWGNREPEKTYGVGYGSRTISTFTSPVHSHVPTSPTIGTYSEAGHQSPPPTRSQFEAANLSGPMGHYSGPTSAYDFYELPSGPQEEPPAEMGPSLPAGR